jgi:hypothetical protein
VPGPEAIPAPPCWLPDSAETSDPAWRPDLTVVDLGWDATRPETAGRGAGAWLRAGLPMPQVILALAPTRVSLSRAEVACHRLAPRVEAGELAPIRQLVVSGARRWPKGVAGAAVTHLTHLVSHAVFLPHDDELATGGIGQAPIPTRLRKPAATVLSRCTEPPGAPPGAFPAPGPPAPRSDSEGATGPEGPGLGTVVVS